MLLYGRNIRIAFLGLVGIPPYVTDLCKNKQKREVELVRRSEIFLREHNIIFIEIPQIHNCCVIKSLQRYD